MKKQTLSSVLRWCSLGTAVSAAVLQSTAILTAYASDRNYFVADTPLPLLAAILAILSGALGILSAILVEKETLASPVTSSIIVGLPAAAGLGFGAFLLLTASTAPLSIVTALTMLGAALYSLLFCERIAARYPRALSLLGFFAVAACAMINVYCYFDASLEMNAPVKVTVQTGLLFAMLYYTSEIRFVLGREKPRLHLALSCCALASLALSAFPIYLAHNNGITERLDYYAFAIASVGILAGILLHLLCYTGVLAQDTAEVAQKPITTSEEAEDTEIPEETDTPEDDSTEEKETDEE